MIGCVKANLEFGARYNICLYLLFSLFCCMGVARRTVYPQMQNSCAGASHVFKPNRSHDLFVFFLAVFMAAQHACPEDRDCVCGQNRGCAGPGCDLLEPCPRGSDHCGNLVCDSCKVLLHSLRDTLNMMQEECKSCGEAEVCGECAGEIWTQCAFDKKGVEDHFICATCAVRSLLCSLLTRRSQQQAPATFALAKSVLTTITFALIAN